MWDIFPIQCKEDKGAHLSTIKPDYNYTRYPDVIIKEWKDVPVEVKRWTWILWKDEFGAFRTPLGPNDLLAWIPKKATLVARRGYWVDKNKSKPMIMIHCNYTHREYRGKGIAERMIHSLGHVGRQMWSIDSFIFEVKQVPKSLVLRNAIPLRRFNYSWIPTMTTDVNWVRMKHRELIQYVFRQQGFHYKGMEGCVGFKNSVSGNSIILDSHNDVVFYDSTGDLTTLGDIGHYCRVFSKFGSHHLYAENMYFDESNEFALIP